MPWVDGEEDGVEERVIHKADKSTTRGTQMLQILFRQIFDNILQKLGRKDLQCIFFHVFCVGYH